MIPSNHPDRPHANCYWVTSQLMAGEYPIERDSRVARRKLDGILQAGISEFLDLTDPADGLNPYQHLPACRPFGYRQMTIRDMDVPAPTWMREILDHLQSRLDAGQKVYVHCWGGIGRTGTVVGCHLVENGMTPEQALEHIAERWQTMEKLVRFPRSPQTDAQVDFVRAWKRRPS
ncbi:dual specificity protein phosphatase family protein [bacterium]|nr:dual specificity protein phosphatase family protein [bacterium]